MLSKFEYINKVYYLSPIDINFSNTYISVRDKEKRYLKDEDVLQLPYISKSNPHFKEWQLRQKSSERFISYLKNKKEDLTILDIGCGNGWFSNLLAETSTKNNIIGLDINLDELEQASRIFNKKNLRFAYGDIFKISSVFKNQFNLIILNASVQYFPDFNKLMSQLNYFLKLNGEIHIIDSPFYSNHERTKAKERTKEYYTKLGFPEMALNYFHHLKTDVINFRVLYKPKTSIFRKKFKKDSPFSWYSYKQNSAK